MDDDYVAQVIAKEARDSSQKYASEGLGAYMPVRKPASNAPKPNTRFLRHLIKETDSHNLALKRKEERESRDRMRQLGRQTTTGTSSTSHTSRQPDRQDTRDSDRRRAEDRQHRHRSHRRRHRSRSASTGRGRDRDRERSHRRRDRDNGRDQTDRRRSYSRSRSRSPRRDCTSRRHRSERHHRRSGSPSGTRSSRSHREEKARGARHDKVSRSRLSSEDLKDRATKPPPVVLMGDNSAEESDPLEDLVGPLPQKSGEEPIRSRGRGAYKPNSSTIDAHFAPDYDPTLDVQLDGDGERVATARASRRPVAGLTTDDDDWDMALEALRDRAHWRQKGDERLRAAGMNENTIGRWKDNDAFSGLDGEGKPEDVRWSKKGEGREWDRGKFVNDDGHIDVRAAWQS